MKSKILSISKEILLSFEKQFPEKWNSYNEIIQGTLFNPSKDSYLEYCNMMDDLDMLVSIIKKRIIREIKK
jgi:hypothetical protein